MKYLYVMKSIKLIVFILGSFGGFYSNAGEINPKGNKKILILGNSIVNHAPKPDIGWLGDWGMAASCRDSDFVHILIRDIKTINSQTEVKLKNIAQFENTYVSYNLKKLKSCRQFKPDVIIVKISENVNDSTAYKNDFSAYYKQLLHYIDPHEHAYKIIVDGFWPRPNVNKIVRQVAIDGNHDFVSITSLFNDSTNTAKGLFEHKGVALHPSDQGMRKIAELIWQILKKYLG